MFDSLAKNRIGLAGSPFSLWHYATYKKEKSLDLPARYKYAPLYVVCQRPIPPAKRVFTGVLVSTFGC